MAVFVVIAPQGTATRVFEPFAQPPAVIAAALLTVSPVPLPFNAVMQAEASASTSAQAVALTGIGSPIAR